MEGMTSEFRRFIKFSTSGQTFQSSPVCQSTHPCACNFKPHCHKQLCFQPIWVSFTCRAQLLLLPPPSRTPDHLEFFCFFDKFILAPEPQFASWMHFFSKSNILPSIFCTIPAFRATGVCWSLLKLPLGESGVGLTIQSFQLASS